MTTEADKLWAEISKLPIDMWGLPNQRIKNHVEKLAGTDEGLFLKLNSPAGLPALEAALAAQQQFVTEDKYDRHHQGEDVDVSYPKYELEQADNYVIVKRHIPPTVRKELQAEVFISNKRNEPAPQGAVAKVAIADKEDK